jgi:hypothetical protein
MSDNMAEENYRYYLFASWRPILKYAWNPSTIISLEQHKEKNYYSIIVYRTQDYTCMGCREDKKEAIQKYKQVCHFTSDELESYIEANR